MDSSEDFDDPRFEHDMLTAMIMLHEGRNGNPVSFEGASRVSCALMREDEHLPLDELRPKQTA